MNRQRRLLDSDDAAIRDLLAAGLRDNPRPQALARVAASLGIAASTLPATATAGAIAAHAGELAARGTGATGIGAAATGAVHGGSHVLVTTAAQWLLIGMLGGGVTAGGWASLQAAFGSSRTGVSQTTRTAIRPPASSSQSAAARTEAMAAHTSTAPPMLPVTRREATPSPSIATDLQTDLTDVTRSSRTEHASDSAEEAGALARETSLIDATRRALARGDWSQAQALLETYDATRRLGVLDREALLLRIEIQTQRGDRSRAQELARVYVARYPDDAHVRRLRAYLREPRR